MATAINNAPRAGDTITLEPGVPVTFAPKYIEGKNLGDSKFPPFLPRVLFTDVAGRKLFLDSEDASDFERGMRELGISPANGDFVRVVLVKHPKGGGHSIRVERAEDAPPDASESRTERELRASLALIEARKREKAGAVTPASQTTITTKEGAANGVQPAASMPNGTPINATTARICASYMCAIDAMHEARECAARKGYGEIKFTSEDLRATALSVFIAAERRAS